MKFRYTHERGIETSTPPDDDLTSYAAQTYGHCLNTPDRQGRDHSAREFAAAIRECYDTTNPRNAAIVLHLEARGTR